MIAGRRSRVRDPRTWLGIVIAAGAIAFALRGVDLGAVAAEFARADWVLLLGLSVPSYVGVVWLRALRWRHLTDAIQPMPVGTLFRAVAVGFLANNLFPLRVGEFVRCWYLSRETGAPVAAVLGTVVLERVADALCVIGMALGVIWMWGDEASVWRRGVAWLVPAAGLPLLAVGLLRAAPERSLAWLARGLQPLPERWSRAALDQLEAFATGLGALRGGGPLGWVALHSLAIWGLASLVPFLASFAALDVPLGSPARWLAAGWMTLAAVGIAVALPAAPGFFGLYHTACRLVLERFGIPAETALALGTLNHAVFWVSLTGLGLLALRGGPTSLGDLDRAAQEGGVAPGPDPGAGARTPSRR